MIKLGILTIPESKEVPAAASELIDSQERKIANLEEEIKKLKSKEQSQITEPVKPNKKFDSKVIADFNRFYHEFFEAFNGLYSACQKVNDVASYSEYVVLLYEIDNALVVEVGYGLEGVINKMVDLLEFLVSAGYDDSSIGSKMRALDSINSKFFACATDLGKRYG